MRAAFAAAAAAAAPPPAPRPNVLFVVVDDLSTAITPYGGLAEAPSIARLAAKGVQLNSAHVSVAVCAPSRTAFLTGLRCDTTQVWTIGPYFRRVARGQGMGIVTLPEMFRRAGYNSTGGGKIFHPGTPSGGFISSEGGGDMCPAQSDVGLCSHAPATDEPGSWTEPYWFCDQYTNDTVQSPAMQEFACSLHGRERKVVDTYSFPSCGGGCVQNATCIACFQRCGTWGKGGAWDACDCPDQCYPEGVIADQAIRVLREKAAHPDWGPWFHAVGFKRPHLTYRAPARYFAVYNASAIPLPTHRFPSPTAPPISYSHSCQADNHASGKPQQCVKQVSQRNVSAYSNGTGTAQSYIEVNVDDAGVRQMRLAYYAVISFMDAQFGRVLDALDETGLASSTIVTFIGDHGYQNGEKGEWCKSNAFELATRIPMLVSVPAAVPGDWGRGVQRTALVESVDLLPTLADLAGLTLPAQALAGESLRPLLARQMGTRQKTWALSQWPRRPSCTAKHGCTDGHGNPYEDPNDQAVMGYKLRTDRWAYICWFDFDWGEGGDPGGVASRPLWDRVLARELYDHAGDSGDYQSGEEFEYDNLAERPEFRDVVAGMHTQLVAAVHTGLVMPDGSPLPPPPAPGGK